MELFDHAARLKIKSLDLVKVDHLNWLSYYIDPRTKEKWIEDRPQSEYHGGGPPRLRLVDNFGWEEEVDSDLKELDKLFASAYDLQEKASNALGILLKACRVDLPKEEEFQKAIDSFHEANDSFHRAYDKLIAALKKGGNKYSIVLTGAILEIDKPYVGFKNGLAIASMRTGKRIYRNLNDL